MLAPALPALRNRYFALRHGSSRANARGIIVSDPRRGQCAFGLTPGGRIEVLDTMARWRHGTPLVVCSPFLRARQTADIAHATLCCGEPVTVDARLRERCFGTLEGRPTACYEDVWTADARDPAHRLHDVEPAVAVRARTVALIGELEAVHTARFILLVAHGDTLQLLWTAFAGLEASAHRGRTPLRPGGLEELRRRRAA